MDFEDADLSLLKSFPYANVGLTNLSLVNKAPFEGDTLFASSEIELAMSIKELFKSADEPIVIKTLNIDGAKLHIKADAEGNANYDIAKESETTTSPATDESSSNFTLNMDSYAISNSEIIYEDMASGMVLDISEMNHSGTGDLSLEKSELKPLPMLWCLLKWTALNTWTRTRSTWMHS